MSKTGRKLHPIDIPDFAFGNCITKEVSVQQGERAPYCYGNYVIGEMLPDCKMYPNDNFRIRHPDLWVEHYGFEDLGNCALSAGLFAVLMKIANNSGLMSCAREAFGKEKADAFFDIAMFALSQMGDDPELLANYSKLSAVFLKSHHDAAWFSQLLTSTGDDQFEEFKKLWAATTRRLTKNRKMWILFLPGTGDVSDFSSHVKDGSCGGGGSKSSSEADRYSDYIIVAVQSQTLLPFYWTVKTGDTTDEEAVESLISFLNRSKLKVEGASIGPGINSKGLISILDQHSIHWVKLLTSDHKITRKLMANYAVDPAECSGSMDFDEDLSAFTEPCRLYDEMDELSATLFFNFDSAAQDIADTIDAVNDELDNLLSAIKCGIQNPAVNPDLADYINPVCRNGRMVNVEADTQFLRKQLMEHCYSAVVSSDFDCDDPEDDYFRSYHYKIFSEALLGHGVQNLLSRLSAGNDAATVNARVFCLLITHYFRDMIANTSGLTDCPVWPLIKMLMVHRILPGRNGEKPVIYPAPSKNVLLYLKRMKVTDEMIEKIGALMAILADHRHIKLYSSDDNGAVKPKAQARKAPASSSRTRRTVKPEAAAEPESDGAEGKDNKDAVKPKAESDGAEGKDNKDAVKPKAQARKAPASSSRTRKTAKTEAAAELESDGTEGKDNKEAVKPKAPARKAPASGTRSRKTVKPEAASGLESDGAEGKDNKDAVKPKAQARKAPASSSRTRKTVKPDAAAELDSDGADGKGNKDAIKPKAQARKAKTTGTRTRKTVKTED